MARRLLYFAATIVWWSLVLVTSGPGAGGNWTRRLLAEWFGLSGQLLDVTNFLIRKAAHIFYYACLTFLIALTAWGWIVSSRTRAAITACFLAFATAVFDETRQAVTLTRSGTPFDLLYDSVGIALATVLFFRASRTK